MYSVLASPGRQHMPITADAFVRFHVGDECGDWIGGTNRERCGNDEAGWMVPMGWGRS